MKRQLRSLTLSSLLVSFILLFSCNEDGFVNTDPEIENQSFTIDENSTSGTIVGTINASDIDENQELTFSILSGDTDGAFALSTDGELSIANSDLFDFEQNMTFTFIVQVDDGAEGSAQATITVSVSDINELHSVSDQSFTIEENLSNGTVIGSIVVVDPDQDPSYSYTINSGNIDNAFSINTSGELLINNDLAINFEENTSFTLVIEVEDEIAVEATITISITDVNEIHTVGDQSFSVIENSENGTLVGTIVTADQDASFSYGFDIVSGNDNGVFEVNDQGEILVSSFCDLDFETQAEYNLVISISDDDFEVESTVTVTVTDESIITNGLVAHYPFNGNANDESSNSNDATVFGATLTEDRFGCANSAYSFDGVNDYIDTFTSFDNQNQTLSLWCSTNGIVEDSFTDIIAVQDSDALTYGRMLISFSGDSLNASMGSDVEKITQPFESDIWYHVVVTRDATEVKMYVNGNLIFTGSPGTIGSASNAYENLIFGCNRHRNRGYFNGAIDDVRVYDRALTLSEITSIYDSTE